MRARLCLACLLVACNGHHGGDNDAQLPVGCGDGVKSGSEQCDGVDLGSATCASATAPGWVGVLSCTASCQINVAGCNLPTKTWSTLTDAALWSTFDLTTLFPGAKGFESSVFDGRYLYLVPNNNGAVDGIVARYDTQGGFGSSGSWQTFDVATVSAAAKGFQGGAFDGRYVYLVPYNAGTSGTVARYDTQAAGSFGAATSWSVFDLTTVDPKAHGYVRAAFDGRYLYLAPHYNGAYMGVAARYDTAADFGSKSSWQTFDISTAHGGAMGFLGAEFDGRYVYYVPYYNGTAHTGLVARFDTRAADGFASAASWSFFDLQSVNGNAVGFHGVSFDGRYLYLAQLYNGALGTSSHYGGLVARYDTQADFSTGGSWSTFDLQSINGGAAGFVGAAFDGRYVYLAPYYNDGGYHAIVPRYDTKAGTFATGASWEVFNVQSVAAGAAGYHGVGFDGQYIYLVPSWQGPVMTPYPHGKIARFEAKSPSWLPLSWNRTFD